MPKRSTPFQAIVRLVRQRFAQAGVTVTESKMLRDAVLDIEREVDIVIEGEFDGEPNGHLCRGDRTRPCSNAAMGGADAA